ncbi:MAG TPA: hypothetical protein PLO37_20905 [Candidatus Hydrogenedentes bacterium]|nr:hypothetical protein [Candidatus Hydrogenedentota bacterium]HPG69314.1 hypothetical protein [Candidatus Hydrogenedentota bacterium]
MDSAELRRRFQLALSYREQVKKAIEGRAHAHSSSPVSFPDAASCTRHFEAAKAELTRLREALREESPRLAAHLRDALADQTRLETSVREGRTSRQAAREMGRHINTTIEALRRALAELNALNAARTAEEVGGFIDLPLDAYAPATEGKTPVPQTPSAKRARPQWRFTWSYSNVLSVVVVVMGVAVCIYILSRGVGTHGEVSFAACIAPGTAQAVEITVKNDRKAPIAFHAPWPSGTPTVGDASEKAYGVTLSVREAADAPWRLVPAEATRWIQNGLGVEGERAFAIGPRLSMAITLDVQRLSESGISPKAIKLDFASGEGKLVTTFETQVAP